jgi:hypothetical protein
VLQGTRWIHRDERARAVEGTEKDFVTGQWLSALELRHLREGWARQDLDWIEPADAPHADAGLWRVGGDWVDLATADRRHAGLDAPWLIPSREVLLHSTAERAVALRALEHMGRALEDLNKVFGAEPALPLEVTLLRDEEQYDRLAFGDPDGRRQASETARLHLVDSAYFAESWFARARGKSVFHGMGVTYWDPLAPNGDAYGVHAARLAVGLSYVDALDPQPEDGEEGAERRSARRLPRELRVGEAPAGMVALRRCGLRPALLPRRERRSRWRRVVGARVVARQPEAARRPARAPGSARLPHQPRRPRRRAQAAARGPACWSRSWWTAMCAPVAAGARRAEARPGPRAGAKKAQVEALTGALSANEAALRAYADRAK